MTDITPFTVRCHAQFLPVAEQFKQNFADGLEQGASFVIYQNGEQIISLYGGWADKANAVPVTDKTLFSVFSSGKAAAALIMAHLAEQNRFGYDQPIRSIWPEFDTHGKGDLTVAQILSHQSGLSGITNPNWTPEDWFDWDKTCAELAGQAPIFPPGSASGYCPVTFGFLAGEIARRTDKYGRSLGTILRQDICDMHNLDIWIGLPQPEHARTAYMQKPKGPADMGEINAATRAAFLQKWSSPGGRGRAAWLEAEFAGSNCQATADSLARIMRMAVDGFIGAEKYLSEDVLGQLQQVRISGSDRVLPFDLEFAAGLMRNAPNFFYGPNDNAYGHSGWGGSCLFADPDKAITGAYAMNRQDAVLLGDSRPVKLIKTLYSCL